jgi:hypothetical protein
MLTSGRIMDEINVKDWDHFEEVLKSQEAFLEKASQGHYTPLLFRGQGNSKWNLKTTLERYIKTSISVRRYFLATERAKPTFTDDKWDDLDFSKVEHWCNNHGMGKIPDYEYLAFLRHLGFPSPLLDWTESRHVAAFFAFRNPEPDVERVSIYAYCDLVHTYPLSIRSYMQGGPMIHHHGPDISTHARHTLQKCHYTTCTRFDKTDNQLRITPHDHERDRAHMHEQDVLWKFNIPVTERIKVFSMLRKQGIDAFSLFNSPETLAEKLAFEVLLSEPS